MASPYEDDPAEAEALSGECRHGCNGFHVTVGCASDTCDWQCHQGLELDPERAARFDAITGSFPHLAH